MKITAREKKYLVIGGGILAMSALLYAGLELIPSGAASTGSVDHKKRVLLQYRETIGREKDYKTRVEQYNQRLTQNMSRLLPFDNPTIAAAELQKVLKDIADQNGVEIIRKDIQKEQRMQDLVKVAVRIETNCVPDQLVQFLAAVENYDKFLSVDELVINSFRIQKKYEIRPSLVVSGYIAAAETKPAEKIAGTR